MHDTPHNAVQNKIPMRYGPYEPRRFIPPSSVTPSERVVLIIASVRVARIRRSTVEVQARVRPMLGRWERGGDSESGEGWNDGQQGECYVHSLAAESGRCCRREAGRTVRMLVFYLDFLSTKVDRVCCDSISPTSSVQSFRDA